VYWKLPLAPDSRECQSFITPDGVFSPTRVLHGTTNAVSHMQAVLQEILLHSVEQILAWLDEILLHAVKELELLTHLLALFLIRRQYNLKLHPGKCSLYATKLRWCGRLISPTGVCFGPRRVQGLRDMEPPSMGAELQQFVCALNWMRTSLPKFSQLIAPLQAILELVYQAAGGQRTRTASAKIPLIDVGWDSEDASTFRACQAALERVVTLRHPALDKRLCLYTDASLEFWLSVIAHVPPADLDCPAVAQLHEPLVFLSGKLTGPMRRWPIIEKKHKQFWLLSNA
jgi:hypothetical protein